jgi:hypothetical protein
MKTTLLTLVFALLMISSCSDSGDDSPFAPGYDPDGNIFPMEIGNWWKYENFDLDSLGKIDESTKTVDSMYVAGSAIKLGEDCKKFNNHIDIEGGSSSSDEMYFRYDGEKVYALSTMFSMMMPFGDMMLEEEEWIKIVDPNDDVWMVMDLEGVEIPGFNVAFDMQMTCQKGLSETVVLPNGKECPSDKYIMTAEIEMAFELYEGLPPIDVTITADITNWYSPGIGLVKMEVGNMQIDAGAFTQVMEEYFDTMGEVGAVRYLIDYNLN